VGFPSLLLGVEAKAEEARRHAGRPRRFAADNDNDGLDNDGLDGLAVLRGGGGSIPLSYGRWGREGILPPNLIPRPDLPCALPLPV
jgi:hypothetical protein